MNCNGSRKDALRVEILRGLQSIQLQAGQGQRMSPLSDNLCDLLDNMDNELQTVIQLVVRVRAGE